MNKVVDMADTNHMDQGEPDWISELRAELAATQRDYHNADRLMCMAVAPDLVQIETEVVSWVQPDDYWPNREVPLEDLAAAAELEERVMAVFPLYPRF